MKLVRSTRIMILLIVLSIVLSVSFAVLLVRQEMQRRRSGIEFEVYKVLTGLVDVYNAEGSINPLLWPELNGFGIYSLDGIVQFQYGTAPDSLQLFKSISARGFSDLSGSSMTIIRRTGAPPPMQEMHNGMRMENPPHCLPNKPFGIKPNIPQDNGRFRRDGPMNLPRASSLVFIEINVESFLREGRLVFSAVVALLTVFISIVSLLLFYSRKIAMYRERERTTSHLVQLGEAARTLAHEIKNPLGVIRVQCATLKRTLSEDRQKNIGVIEEETERLVQLTNRVRDFLHNPDVSLQLCEASSFLEQCRHRYCDQIRILPWTGNRAYFNADPTQVTQVIDNLISNALEASAEASESRSIALEIPELSLNLRRNTVSFCVADRGNGVSPENRSRLFELFFTTKARGSGIGLALARRYMEYSLGTLVYEERSGGGSMFIASFPVAKKGASL